MLRMPTWSVTVVQRIVSAFILLGSFPAVEAQVQAQRWTYTTSLTGFTRFDTLEGAETAMRATRPDAAILVSSGVTETSHGTLVRHYEAAPKSVLADDSVP